LCILIYYAPAFFIVKHTKDISGQLKVGGTSGVAFMMDKWKNVYYDKNKIAINYDSTGSTKGLAHMLEQDYAIGFTHAPLSEEQQKKAQEKGGVIYIPVLIGAVVPIYNLPELKGKPPLNFTGEVLADIYLGKIERWNDPALKKVNEGVVLPETKIAVVHRQDSSGTTYSFTEYLYGVSEAWQKQLGAPSSKIDWPVGVGQDRNHNVAHYVSQTEGAIGYVDLLHALDDKIQYGAVQNKDKTAFIHAGPENMAAAAKGLNAADINDDLTFNLTSRPGKESYPICGAVWAVCYLNQPAAQEKLVVDFLHWMTHEGQSYTKERVHAPLPEELIQRVDEKLKSIKTAS